MKLLLAKSLMWIFYFIRNKYWLALVKFIDIYALTILNDPAAMRKHLKYWEKENNFKEINIHNSKFIVNINDHIGYNIYMNGSFDEAPLTIARKLNLGEGDILLDIGANIGSVCIPIAEQTKCEIFAVEASSSVAFQLLRNVSLNSIKFSMIHGAAVNNNYSSDEYLKLYVRHGNVGANSLFSTWNSIPGAPESIEYAKPIIIDELGEIVDFQRIKLIKIDVEGAEYEVLKGMNKLMNLEIPILFEHRIDMLKNHRNEDGNKIINLLKEKYELFGVNENDKGEWVISTFIEDKSYANVLAVSKNFNFNKLL